MYISLVPASFPGPSGSRKGPRPRRPVKYLPREGLETTSKILCPTNLFGRRNFQYGFRCLVLSSILSQNLVKQNMMHIARSRGLSHVSLQL